MRVLNSNFTVCLHMDSDWHVGTGAGIPGNIDRVLSRDSDGLPFVPAKTLIGIWRDACERLAWALDGGPKDYKAGTPAPDGSWLAWVDILFGSEPSRADRTSPVLTAPRPAALSVRPASLSGGLREALAAPDREALRAALTFVKPGVAIDRKTGAAKDDHLRFEEQGRIGTVLDATCELRRPPDVLGREAATALLAASAALVERLGGNRRRGSGCCRLVIADFEDIQPVLEWLNACSKAPAVPPAWDHDDATGDLHNAPHTPHSSGVGSAWAILPLRLELHTPLLAYERTAGNVVRTLDFVPGTYLLPHLTALLRRRGMDIRPLVARGDVCVLPATIEVGGSAGRPTPMALAEVKGSKGFQEAGAIANRLAGEGRIGPQVKPLRKGYIGPFPDARREASGEALIYPTFATVPIASRTHNTIEEDSQRPTSGVGGVFTYEAIAPVTRDASGEPQPVVLRSEVRIRAGLKADVLKQLVAALGEDGGGRCRLGRSSKDDYGDVTISADNIRDVQTDAPERFEQIASPEATVTVWLLSDVLLRDATLRPATTTPDFEVALSEALQVHGGGVENEAPKCRCVHEESDLSGSYMYVRRLESWHVSWGMPRPSLLGLQAGSCFRMKITGGGAGLAAALRSLEEEGLGDRRGEGYGRVRFNDPLLAHKLADGLAPPKENAAVTGGPSGEAAGVAGPLLAPSASDPASAFAATVEKETWRRELLLAAQECAADESWRRDNVGICVEQENGGEARSKPPMSQLGALRSAVATVRGNNNKRAVVWLQRLVNVENRRRKWHAKALPGKNAALEPGFVSSNEAQELGKIGRLLCDRGRVWELLLPHGNWPTLTEGASDRLRQELWAEAVRSLVDACVRAQKRQIEDHDE